MGTQWCGGQSAGGYSRLQGGVLPCGCLVGFVRTAKSLHKGPSFLPPSLFGAAAPYLRSTHSLSHQQSLVAYIVRAPSELLHIRGLPQLNAAPHTFPAALAFWPPRTSGDAVIVLQTTQTHSLEWLHVTELRHLSARITCKTSSMHSTRLALLRSTFHAGVR
ncbi:hypothetical protein IQ07DRAFT_94467 [Pyrenochaeta sp. DS3sAY3a]|nr:hypothetical protein IQ07DRAFT_94467 [Pyrenochaeta sp. DS3sAY3a]